MRKCTLYRAGPLLLAAIAGCGDTGSGDMAMTPIKDLSVGDMAAAKGGDMAQMAGADMSATPGADMTVVANEDLTTTSSDMATMTHVNAMAATTGGLFSRPFDAVPSPDGATFYFTALGMNGPGVFSVNAGGGAAKELFSGPPLVAPFGLSVSTDGTTLFIADPGISDDPNMANGIDAKGAIYSLSAQGGNPTAIPAFSGTQPRGLDVIAPMGAMSDSIYFSGRDANDGKPGLFVAGANGGGLQALAKGAPFVDPSGVAVAVNGDVYVVDTVPQSGGAGARVIKVSGNVATELVTGLQVGYPAGAALVRSDSLLLVSGNDAVTGTSVVYSVDVVMKTVSQFSMGIGSNTDSGGLHRARMKADTLSWCGVTAGGGSGVVYRVSLN
jgi:hypothetical protein